jgi:sugar/nucleoside kinase (ribokinase family)
LAAVDQARAGGALVSFDPNLRPALWASLEEAREWMLRGAQSADVLKVSEEELAFLLGGDDLPLEAAARKFHGKTGAQLLFVTLGANGCLWVNAQGWGTVPAPRVNPVDTTGAGDAFVAGLLYGLIRSGQPLATLEPGKLAAMVRFANAAGALTTEKRGAIPALPQLEAILALLK